MNKKLFFGMLAATGMLFATSCSNDELNAVQSGDEAQVTFSLGLEGGIATRAISDGAKAKKLVCAIYNVNDRENPQLLENISINNKKVENGQYVDTEAFDSGLTDNISVTLAKGQEYAIAFWAQNPNCTAYRTTDLQNISINYAGINNDETRDAFYAVETFKVNGNKEIDVTLKRPFAQINVGVTKEDWEAAVASGIEIENSSVTIKNAATALNLLSGDATVAQKATYQLAARPDEMLKVDADNNGEKEEYHWLSMSYILVEGNTEQATLESLQFTFDPASGNDIEFKEGLNTVPVRRNWRTNILGKILTGDIQFNITIDPDFDGDYFFPNEKENSSTQEVEFVATFGGTVNATEDADLDQDYLNVQADAIFNMNGNTLNVAEGQVSGYGARVTNGVTAEFNDANIVSGGAGINVQSGANVVFNSGSIHIDSDTNEGQRYIFYAAEEGTTVTINGGSFSFANVYRKISYICADHNAKVYVTGGEFGAPCQHKDWENNPIYTANGGEVIITGGTFGFDPTTWVAEGYKAIKNGEKWYVVANEIQSVATSDTELREALSSGKNVALAGDVTTTDAESNGYGATGINVNGGVFDGNGHTIKVEGATSTWDSAIAIKGGTIKNLTVAEGFRGIFIKNGTEKVILENVVVDGPTYTISCDQAGKQGLEAYNSTFKGWTSYAVTLGSAYFKNCTFGAGAGYNFSRPYAPTTYVNCAFEAGHGLDARAAVTFENCTIDGVALTADNLSTLVTANITNATVK